MHSFPFRTLVFLSGPASKLESDTRSQNRVEQVKQVEERNKNGKNSNGVQRVRYKLVFGK